MIKRLIYSMLILLMLSPISVYARGHRGHGGYLFPHLYIAPYPYVYPYTPRYDYNPYQYSPREYWIPGYWVTNPETGLQYYVPGHYERY